MASSSSSSTYARREERYCPSLRSLLIRQPYPSFSSSSRFEKTFVPLFPSILFPSRPFFTTLGFFQNPPNRDLFSFLSHLFLFETVESSAFRLGSATVALDFPSPSFCVTLQQKEEKRGRENAPQTHPSWLPPPHCLLHQGVLLLR